MRKPKRAAAPIMPEIAPEAPTSGAWSSVMQHIVQRHRRNAVTTQNRQKRTAPRRLASGEPKAASQTMLIARCAKPPCRKRIGDRAGEGIDVESKLPE